MPERVKFGRPQTLGQALLRFPDRNHPDYGLVGGPVEHLTHLRERLEDILEGEEQAIWFDLEDRWIPLELDDMRILEEVSFRRDLVSAVTVVWERVSENTVWAGVFPCTDEDYRWWQISEMLPPLVGSSYRLICLETNPVFSLRGGGVRFDEKSEFDMLLLRPEEIEDLKLLLTRDVDG